MTFSKNCWPGGTLGRSSSMLCWTRMSWVDRPKWPVGRSRYIWVAFWFFFFFGSLPTWSPVSNNYVHLAILCNRPWQARELCECMCAWKPSSNGHGLHAACQPSPSPSPPPPQKTNKQTNKQTTKERKIQNKQKLSNSRPIYREALFLQCIYFYFCIRTWNRWIRMPFFTLLKVLLLYLIEICDTAKFFFNKKIGGRGEGFFRSWKIQCGNFCGMHTFSQKMKMKIGSIALYLVSFTDMD